MMRIFLVGYMGVGKSTLGRELAKSLKLDFIDLDHFIENRYNKTITQLFDEFGENGFRELERIALKEVSAFENVVVSTGGGTPCFFDNMEIMLNSGITIYLSSDIDVLFKRLNLCKAKRPLLKDKNEKQLLEFITENIEKRHPYYIKSHHLIKIDEFVNKSDVHQSIQTIINIIKSTPVKYLYQDESNI